MNRLNERVTPREATHRAEVLRLLLDCPVIPFGLGPYINSFCTIFAVYIVTSQGTKQHFLKVATACKHKVFSREKGQDSFKGNNSGG